MLSHIPTHIIGGPLGAGKTSLIQHLLAQRPAAERWAVLVNEFGQIGLDAALLNVGDPHIHITEVAGGCLCCVNGVPFQVALGRLLRKAKPHRLFIEPSGLGHPLQLLRQLCQAPWLGVLDVHPLVTVLDAAALAQGDRVPDVHAQGLSESGLIVMNKADDVPRSERERLEGRFDTPMVWTQYGRLDPSLLPHIDHAPTEVDVDLPKEVNAVLPTMWSDVSQPIRQAHETADGWSVGWRFHPSQTFDVPALERWLDGLDYRRAKAIVHGYNGWYAANLLAGDACRWQESAWRRDSRIELIFEKRLDAARLHAGLDACRRVQQPSCARGTP
ncbi:CobW family GTP-binding protein [Pseudomonas matsuisoli]|uniref:Cobalamin biosynthesis protein CobW n=1 Tax=Pseudomonas matsuisoli TaxID=1515666 RepID=A0A917UXF0_9PSED|nr:CobW family GTP-binding protein [Pseudomonas matsuisoli]GGJ94555.1 cobalamin biosynthesis protein CobW [Pseudomonas matsuisoli]